MWRAATLGEIRGGFVRTVEAVGLAGGLGLAHHVEGLGSAHLHLRGEFVSGDAGGEAGVAGMLRDVGAVQLIQQREPVGIGTAGGMGE